jgi:2-keto-4-pentenoate hydratase/2-oxohepta-3-ene-1,7-dioic acid hydratase in catechol pathway
MRICTSYANGDSEGGPAVYVPGRGLAPVERLTGRATGEDLMSYLAPAKLAELAKAAADPNVKFSPLAERLDAPYRRPRKILGIGLNYRSHASDLGADAPRQSPASFLKGDHTIIGPGEPIVIPPGIGWVTAEAELGLVIGRECYQVSADDAMNYVAGLTAVLDQTAEEVLLQNPRFLTRVKNYPTFFSFGPFLVSLASALAEVGDLADLEISTVHNGAVWRQDRVSGMIFSPAELLSFHSHVMPLYPGDILSTGTPGAVRIEPGDVVECRLGDLMTLTNPVVGGSTCG